MLYGGLHLILVIGSCGSSYYRACDVFVGWNGLWAIMGSCEQFPDVFRAGEGDDRFANV